MPSKCILILLDGLGDRAYAQLDHQTPLQAARTPMLDRLAAMGANGLYHAASQGQALPSENAHFAIFGYEPDHFPGRGPLEALGAGIALDNRDVAVLAHFASLRAENSTLMLIDGKPAAESKDLQPLLELAGPFVHDDVTVAFHHTHRLNGIITLRGPVSPYFTDTDPILPRRSLIAVQPLAGYEDDAYTRNSVAALKAYMMHLYAKLKGHPINRSRKQRGIQRLDGLVTQRAGRLKPLASFEQCFGLRGLIMASGLVYHGLARLLGMTSRKVADTPKPGEDLARRLREAHALLDRFDFIHVHTKAPDEAAHEKDPFLKKQTIEALDNGLADAVMPLLDDPEILIVVGADHSTPSAGSLIHSGETVPLMFCGPGIRCDAVRRFDEISAAAGALGHIRGAELMLMILNALDRAKLKGLMDTPHDQPFWPGRYKPFTID
jgi:2,3-bisphosphoglycerate-independent phosphoglycerate mutase